MYAHGQYAGADDRGTFGTAHSTRAEKDEKDDHHSPLNPERYLLLRVRRPSRLLRLCLFHSDADSSAPHDSGESTARVRARKNR